MADALTAFLYTLMREYIPFGQMEQVLQDFETSQAHEFHLSNPAMAQCALSFAQRLQRIDQ